MLYYKGGYAGVRHLVTVSHNIKVSDTIVSLQRRSPREAYYPSLCRIILRCLTPYIILGYLTPSLIKHLNYRHLDYFETYLN